MNNLAIIFPGIGYTADKPLLYFSRRLAAAAGYDVLPLSYGGFPPKSIGDADRMAESVRIAFEQTTGLLSGIDLASRDRILFIGKSIGTVIAARIASESPVRDRIRLVLYTPLEQTFSFAFGDAIVFTGTDDPWVGKSESRISALCAGRGIPCRVIPDANHSLETKDPMKDVAQLNEILNMTDAFIHRPVRS